MGKNNGVIEVMNSIVKRNGEVVDFQPEKITEAVFKAMISIDRGDLGQAQKLTEKGAFKNMLLKGAHCC